MGQKVTAVVTLHVQAGAIRAVPERGWGQESGVRKVKLFRFTKEGV